MKFILLLLTLCCSSYSQNLEFGTRTDYAEIKELKLDEISGMNFGLLNPDVMWMHNDGAHNTVYGINNSGNVVHEIDLPEGTFLSDSDVEDMSIGYFQGESYIFLGDFGDNQALRQSVRVIYFREPEIKNEETKLSLMDISTFKFQYPDGPRDCESMFYDNIDQKLYTISKREKNVFLYSLGEINTEYRVAEKLNTLPYGKIQGFDASGVVAADMSTDGSYLIVKEYATVRYYYRGSQTIKEAIAGKGIEIESYDWNLTREPQGESICWDKFYNYYTSTEIKSFPNLKPHIFVFENTATSVKKK